MSKKSVGKKQFQSVKRFTYLLSDPFPEEKITLGITKKAVLDFLYKGGNPHSIGKELKIATSTTRQHLEELERKGLAVKPKIGRNSYGTKWKITEKGIFLIKKSVGFPAISIRIAQDQSVKHLPPNFNRGHSLNFKLKLPEILIGINNERRKEILNKAGFKYWDLNLFGGGQKIIHDDRKIHWTNRSIIIHSKEGESYFAESSNKSEDNSMIKILYSIKRLERKLDLSLSRNGHYSIKITKRHHALIKNALAMIYNKPNRKKLEIYDQKGLWLLIDNSFNLDELECVHSQTAVSDSNMMRDWANSKKKIFEEKGINLTDENILENFNETDERIKKLSEQSLQLSQVLEQVNNNVINLTKIVVKEKSK